MRKIETRHIGMEWNLWAEVNEWSDETECRGIPPLPDFLLDRYHFALNTVSRKACDIDQPISIHSVQARKSHPLRRH